MKKLIFFTLLVLAGCGQTADEKRAAQEKAYLEKKAVLIERCVATRKVAYYYSMKGEKLQERIWTQRGDRECAEAESY